MFSLLDSGVIASHRSGLRKAVQLCGDVGQFLTVPGPGDREGVAVASLLELAEGRIRNVLGSRARGPHHLAGTRSMRGGTGMSEPDLVGTRLHLGKDIRGRHRPHHHHVDCERRHRAQGAGAPEGKPTLRSSWRDGRRPHRFGTRWPDRLDIGLDQLPFVGIRYQRAQARGQLRCLDEVPLARLASPEVGAERIGALRFELAINKRDQIRTRLAHGFTTSGSWWRTIPEARTRPVLGELRGRLG
jgi:hypothetical protein